MICLSPIRVPNRFKIVNGNSVGNVFVPCGTCVNCIVKKQQAWIFRLKNELDANKFNWFITLTFDDQNLKDVEVRELQLFFKTLRNNGLQFKYFAVGEYGTESERPHYHILFFGLKDPGKVEQLWTKGFTYIKPVYEETLPYVTAYLVTQTDDAHKPIRLMSKGLGIDYVDKFKKWHKNKNDTVTRLKGGHMLNIPRYYREKIFSRGELIIINNRNKKKSEDHFKDSDPQDLINKAENLKKKISKNKKFKI